MNKKLNLYYDEEGDYLEINLDESKDEFFKNIGGGIFQIIDKKTNKVIGISIAGFKKRAEKEHNLNLSLPLENFV
jgi:uncharacterized protein YuzE